MGEAFTDYLHIQLDMQHDDAMSVADTLNFKGFRFNCYNKWTCKPVPFNPHSIAAADIDKDVLYVCTLNKGIDDEVLQYVVENSYIHGGPIIHFKFDMSK